jgi:serine/threonine protein kinase
MASDLSVSNPAVTAPKISSVQDLDAVCEDWDPQTDQVRYTTFYIFDDDDCAFWGKILKPKKDIAMKEYQSALVRIPDEKLYPKMSADLEIPSVQTLSAGDNDETFVKRPNLAIWDLVQDTSFLSNLLLHEAHIMQRIAKGPHRNIIKYRGVRVRRGRVTGIVLDKHRHTLLDHVKSQRSLNIGSFMVALGSAVIHLHSLNLAHNDINPENVLVDKDGLPVLIDFGSCQQPKKRLLTSGTPGWAYDTFTHSDQRNDVFALGKMLLWLENPTFE